MYGVKDESGAAVCRGCLSTDRRLSPLANYELFFTFIDKQKSEELKTSAMLFCWECTALLCRMKLFQNQAQKAHQFLEELTEELPKKGLSQLSISSKHDYDVVIKEVLDCTEEPLPIYIKEETMKLQDNIFNYNSDKAENYDSEDNNHFETNAEFDSGEESEGNSLEQTNTALRRSKRKIKTQNIDSSIQSKVKKSCEKDKNDLRKQKPARKGLRSSGEIIAPLHLEKKSRVDEDIIIKTKIKINNLINGELKQTINKQSIKFPNPKAPSQIFIKIKKENKTQNASNAAASCDLEAVATNPVVTENPSVFDDVDENVNTSTNSELQSLDKVKSVKRPMKNIEKQVDNNEASDVDSNEDKSGNDGSNSDTDKDDSDYVEEFEKDPNLTKEKRKKYKRYRESCLRCVCVKYNILKELDVYFTRVQLNSDELKVILENELSYVNKDQPHGCKYCGLCFRMNKTLAHHTNMRHKQISKCMSPAYSMYRCTVCQKIVRKEHTEAHMKYLHRWKYYCNGCDKDFWDKEQARSHYKEAHTGISCDLCSKVAVTMKAMEKHKQARHVVAACDICGKQYHGSRYLANHVRWRHPAADCSAEQRYCAPCDRQYPSLLAYHNHLRCAPAHNEDKPRLPCPACGKLLRNKTSLRSHYDRFHSDKTRYHCAPCDKYYSRGSGLKAHVERFHLKKKPPRDKLCTVCGRGFSSGRILTHHMRTHTGERPHACPHCPAAFAQPYPLRKHLATQHPSEPGAAPAPDKP